VESGPQRKERLAPSAGRAAIRGAAASGDFDTVVFSGGESTTYLDDVLAMCEEARSHGLRTRLVSNGYWARTPSVAAEMLERLFDGHVDELVISFDEYHVPHIPIDRLGHLREATALASRRPWIIYAAVIAPESAESAAAPPCTPFPRAVVDLLGLYEFDVERCTAFTEVQRTLGRLTGPARDEYLTTLRDRSVITWQSLVIGGRATRLLKDAVPAVPLSITRGGPCESAGRQITLPSNGRAYPCCSLWTNFGDHHFGLVTDEDQFAEAYQRIQREPLVQLIHGAGPGMLVQWLQGRGVSLRNDYTDICSMCEELLTQCSFETLQTEAALCTHAWLVGQLGGADPSSTFELRSP
jgi:hypothetical protein